MPKSSKRDEIENGWSQRPETAPVNVFSRKHIVKISRQDHNSANHSQEVPSQLKADVLKSINTLENNVQPELKQVRVDVNNS